MFLVFTKNSPDLNNTVSIIYPGGKVELMPDLTNGIVPRQL